MNYDEHDEPTPPEGESPGDWSKEQIDELATEAMNTPLAVNLLSRKVSLRVLHDKLAKDDSERWQEIPRALPDYPDKGHRVARGLIDELGGGGFMSPPPALSRPPGGGLAS